MKKTALARALRGGDCRLSSRNCAFCRALRKASRPRIEPRAKISQQMHRLNRIEVTTAYPFLLNVYHDFSVGSLSEDELKYSRRFTHKPTEIPRLLLASKRRCERRIIRVMSNSENDSFRPSFTGVEIASKRHKLLERGSRSHSSTWSLFPFLRCRLNTSCRRP